MTQPLAGQASCMLGKSPLTFANMITAAAPPGRRLERLPHLQQALAQPCRFRGVTALAMADTLSAANIWSGGRATTTRPRPGSSPQQCLWPTGHNSSWHRWSRHRG